MSRMGSRSGKNPSMSCSAAGQGEFADDAASGESGVQSAGMVQIDSDMAPKHVTYVAYRLSDEQKELFADMTFGAMLSLPQILKVDRQFSLWVYSRIDPDQPAVEVGDGSFRPMDLSAVRLVTGLGNGSREIKFPHQASCADRQIFEDVCVLLNIDPKTKFITLSDLERILLHPIEPMSEDERARQCAAFALLCGSCMFNPVCRHKKSDPIPPELFLAVRDPTLIPEMNWNKYILDVLLACVRKLRADLEAGESSVYLTGFHLVPQVIYLDAMSKGNGVVPGNPRLPLYSEKQIKSMIIEDTDQRNTSGRMKAYGKCKVRPYRTPVQPAVPPVGADRENPICVSSEEGAVLDYKIYALADLPEYQAQVLEFVSADVHDHMSAVNEENLNLKNHVESMLGSFMGMIDARNESNVNTVNTMLSRILKRVGSLCVQIVEGVLRFVDIDADFVDEQDMVGKGKEHVASDIGTEKDGAGVSEVKKTTLTSKGGGTELVRQHRYVYNRALKQRLNRHIATDVDVSQVAGSSHMVPTADVMPSPESLDLNRRAVLREEADIGGSAARRLEMNTPSHIQHGFHTGAVGESGGVSMRNEQLDFVTAFMNGANPPLTAVPGAVTYNSMQSGLVDPNNSLVGHPLRANSSMHPTAGASSPRDIPLSTPIASGQYGTSGVLHTDHGTTNLIQHVHYLNVPAGGSCAVNTSLALGNTGFRVTDEQHLKRGYAQSSLLGWANPMCALKRSRVPDFGLANSVDFMTPEQVSARRDEKHYNLLMSATFNEAVREWFKHNGPITLVLTGGDVRAQFREGGYLRKNAIEAILTLRLFPVSSGKIVLGPNWAEHCKMQFQLAYSNFYWDVPEVKWMFDNKSPDASSVTAMAVVYVKNGWCLYVFDVAQPTLHVVDPLVATRDVQLMPPKHKKYMEDTLRGFIKCAHAFWGPASVPAQEKWTPVFHPAYVDEVTDSGLQCLHHIMTFIPSQRALNLPSQMAGMLKRKFLRAIMTSSGNVGDLPVRLQMK